MKKRDVRLTSAAHREHFDAFYDAFQDAGRREGWRSSETLRHWLEAAFLAVRGRTLVPGGAAWRKNEDEFLKAERRWREPEKTKADLARMLGAAALALMADPVDFVGPVFNEIAADSGMGQFFTPHDVSLLIAKMTFGATRESVNKCLRVWQLNKIVEVQTAGIRILDQTALESLADLLDH